MIAKIGTIVTLVAAVISLCQIMPVSEIPIGARALNALLVVGCVFWYCCCDAESRKRFAVLCECNEILDRIFSKLPPNKPTDSFVGFDEPPNE